MKYKKEKTTVLLVNLGTPKSPGIKDVKKYLSEFLNDHRVINVPWLLRKILVNLIIVPFRAPKSAKIYQELWTKNGSPLLFYGERVRDLLQDSVGKEIKIELAMRYQEPSMVKALERIRANMPDKLILLPLYPQYASSTTGSVYEKAMKLIQSWRIIPETKFVTQFFDHEGFLNTIVQNAKKHDLGHFDHFLFSYHSLPLSEINSLHPGRNCENCTCQQVFNPNKEKFCYKATCYETSRLLAKKMGIPFEKYTIAFQSRFSKKWLSPFSDKTIMELARQGCKNLLVFSPSFVADCLETTIEIEREYSNLFCKHGGEKLTLVESLNDHPFWIKTLKEIILKKKQNDNNTTAPQ